MERFSALIGFVVILGIAWFLSNNKKAIRWKTVAWGLVLQIVIAILVLITVAAMGAIVVYSTRPPRPPAPHA